MMSLNVIAICVQYCWMVCWCTSC